MQALWIFQDMGGELGPGLSLSSGFTSWDMASWENEKWPGQPEA